MKLSCLFSALTLALPAFGASGTLQLCIRMEPRTFDPLLVDDASSETIRYLTGGVLIRVDRPTQKLLPELATRWTVSDGGRRVTFQLRPGVRFSDGTPFQAEDVVYTLRRMLDPATHSPLADAFGSGGSPVDIRATTPGAVTVRFPKAIAGLPSLFDQIPMMSAHSPLKEKAVLGPFTVTDHQAGATVTLHRNPNYWKKDDRGQALPYAESVRLSVQGNREAEALELERGEIDMIQNVDPEIYDRLSHSAAEQQKVAFTDAGPSLDSEQMWFNMAPTAPLPAYKKAWFAEAHFRRAVSMAIRRSDLCRLIYHGHAMPAFGPVSPSNRLWFNPSLPKLESTPEQAAREFSAAGFHKRGDSLFDAQGHPVEFSLVTNAGSKIHERMMALLQQDLARVGIKLNVVTLDFASLIERITRTFAYESCLMFLTNVGVDPNDQMNVWLSSSGNHQWNPNQKTPATPWEAEMDRLMEAQATAVDAHQRKAYFDRVQQIVSDQAPFIYLVNPNALSASSKRVRGVAPCQFTPQIYWNAERLSVNREVPVASARP